jgi:hypothetical protein
MLVTRRALGSSCKQQASRARFVRVYGSINWTPADLAAWKLQAASYKLDRYSIKDYIGWYESKRSKKNN